MLTVLLFYSHKITAVTEMSVDVARFAGFFKCLFSNVFAPINQSC